MTAASREGRARRRRIHLTGANGFIGRALRERLARAGHAVSGSDLHGAEGVTALDLRDRAAVAAHLAACAPDTVIHAGAISGAMLAQDDPALMFDVNVGGTMNLAEAMRHAGLCRMVFLSSNAVYAPAPTRALVREDAPLGAGDPYGASKLAAESILRAYADTCGIAVTALRISSVFGAGRMTPDLIWRVRGEIAAGTSLTVTDTRSNMRQLVHVSDACEAVCRAVEAGLSGFTPINVTGGTYLSEEQVVRLLLRGRPDVPVHVIADRGRDDDGRVGPLDISRAADMLGYRPAVDLSSALAEIAETMEGSRAG